MDNALKGLIMAAGVAVTCMIISIGFYAAREAKSAAFASAEEISSLKTRIEDSRLTKYDGVVMTGNEVVNFINDILYKYEGEDISPVSVKIIDEKEVVFNNSDKLYELRDKGSIYYIAPTKEFKVRIVKDSNRVISEVIFTNND